MQRFIKLCIITLFIFTTSCFSSTKLIEKGMYKEAIKKSRSLILKNKNIDLEMENLHLALFAYENEIISEIENHKARELDLEKQLKFQIDKSMHLHEIFTSNEEFLSPELKNRKSFWFRKKHEIPYELANLYLDLAINQASVFDSKPSKQTARQANYYFYKLIKLDIDFELPEKLMDRMVRESIEKISVHVDNFEFEVNQQFFWMQKSRAYRRYLQESNSTEIDCIINIEVDFFDISDSENVCQELVKKDVVTGQNTVTDTSGNTTHTPIYSEVTATIVTTTTKRQVTSLVRYNVTNKSGLCTCISTSFRPRFEYEKEVTTWFGDNRALPSNFSTNCMFQSELPTRSKIKAKHAKMVLEYFERSY